VPGPSPKISEPDHALEDVRMRSLKLLCLSGLSGFPQVQIPAGLVDGAPIGLSVLGPHGSDLSLVQLAVKLSKAMAVKIA
jgi:amidase